MKTHQFETKKFATKLVNGKKVVTGAVWRWGPLLERASKLDKAQTH